MVPAAERPQLGGAVRGEPVVLVAVRGMLPRQPLLLERAVVDDLELLADALLPEVGRLHREHRALAARAGEGAADGSGLGHDEEIR